MATSPATPVETLCSVLQARRLHGFGGNDGIIARGQRLLAAATATISARARAQHILLVGNETNPHGGDGD